MSDLGTAALSRALGKVSGGKAGLASPPARGPSPALARTAPELMPTEPTTPGNRESFCAGCDPFDAPSAADLRARRLGRAWGVGVQHDLVRERWSCDEIVPRVAGELYGAGIARKMDHVAKRLSFEQRGTLRDM